MSAPSSVVLPAWVAPETRMLRPVVIAGAGSCAACGVERAGGDEPIELAVRGQELADVDRPVRGG